jgi:CheY-like chemotaxis protein
LENETYNPCNPTAIGDREPEANDGQQPQQLLGRAVSVAQETSAEDRTQSTPKQFAGHNERVLYIDDEEALVLLMTKMLQRLGYKVTGCTDPEQALEIFRSGKQDFDVVVSDLSMPQMSGIDFARELLQIRPGMPIVIASGYIVPADNEEARGLGLPDLLLKPKTAEELGQALHNVFAIRKPYA